MTTEEKQDIGSGVAEQGTIGYALGRSTLGEILLAATSRGVCALLLGDRADRLVAELEERFPGHAVRWEPQRLSAWMERAVALVLDPARGFDLPLDPRGSAFERRVWRALGEIPPGATATYGAIARRLGAPEAARAVGRACAANPVAVAVPCHRVVRADGGLGGYRWGIERKRALLAREAVA